MRAAMGEQKPLVFVSHAGDDKSRHIRPIVDALLAEGFEVFVDRPRDMGYRSSEIDGRFKYIPAGGEWDAAIREGLRQCDVILACFSKALLEDRRILREEINFGVTGGKIVSCRVDDLTPEELKTNDTLKHETGLNDLHKLQAPAVDTKALRSALKRQQERRPLTPDSAEDRALEDMRFLMQNLQRVATGRASLPPKDSGPDWDDLLRAVDRREQRVSISETLQAIRDNPMPHALVLAGPRNERVTDFVHDLVSDPRGGGGAMISVKYVAWVKAPNRDSFETQYRSALTEGLFGGDGLTKDNRQIAEEIRRHAQATVICLSSVKVEHLTAACLAHLDVWRAFWASLARAHGQMSVIPILCIEFDECQPGWQTKEEPIPPEAQAKPGLFGRKLKRAVDHKSCITHVRSLQSGTASDVIPLTVAELFHPVEASDVDQWIRSRLTGAPERVVMAIDKLFKGDLPVQPLAKALSPQGNRSRVVERELGKAHEHGLSMNTLHALVKAIASDRHLLTTSS